MLGLTLVIGTAQAAVITVTTTDNTSVSGFSNALAVLNDGDTIQFNIPGAGVHTIDTPADGYPLIHRNNITIDGYSQPGSSLNTAGLNAANNAQLNICLSSKNGNALSMYSACTNFAGFDYPNFGFGDGEQAILGFFRASNVWVKGIAFLAAPQTSTSHQANGDCKTICFAVDAPDVSTQSCQGFHVSGCWFGVDPTTRQLAYMPDAVTVATPAICIATYGTGTNGTPGYPNIENYPGPGTIGVAAGSANPRAEFNVFVTGYGFDSQGGPFRICGNFWNVLPDGVTLADISVLNAGAQQGDAFVEFGSGHDLIIGTDGDGVNDADEGNVFGSYKNGGDDIYYYGSQGVTVVAGNTFGVDIHGKSFGVGQMTKIVHHFNHDATCQVRFGSDFNGVSDALEGNRVVDALLFDNDSQSAGTNSHWFSFRGNSFTNTVTPYGGRPPIGDGQTAVDGLYIYTNFIDVSGINGTVDIIPVIGATTTTTSLSGTCGKPVGAPYTRVIVDLYQADPGAPANLPQGLKWLGSFTDNGPEDSNSAVGAFTFNIASLGIAHGTPVTIAVTYSRDTQPTLGPITRAGNQTTLGVTNGFGPATYAILKSSAVSGPYSYTTATAGGSAVFTDNNNPTSFYRATGPTATGQTSPFSDAFTIP
jgi:hypothetical protein